jgi:V/A-type H+-transporting ATPase subunit A
MLRMILKFGDLEQEAVAKGVTVGDLQKMPVRTKLSRMKWIPETEADKQFADLERETELAVGALAAPGGS